MFRPPIACLRVALHCLEEGDTGTKIQVDVETLGVPSLKNVINREVNHWALGSGVSVCIHDITVLDDETQKSTETDK